ncbi:MAG: ASKHA domain-containing protein [Coriobacteriales bacterium]|jgi:uncharacterized 2Fe-2S/4Fe-4S cluster protein (DUF4445 family)
MEILVRSEGKKQRVAAISGDTVLDTLRDAGIKIEAACGGQGTCGKCRVMVRDSKGVGYRLACQTPVEQNMEVTIEASRPMSVATAGSTHQWPADGGGWGYGVAIDVGTTTLVCRLYNLETGELLGALGNSNPQVIFGADVISRIHAASEGHLHQMATLLGDELVGMVAKLVHAAHLTFNDIQTVCIAGNTVMEHIAIGLDPAPIGVAPFTPASYFGDEIEYLALAEEDIAAGSAYFAPCLSGYVGGDITCGLVARDIIHREKKTLFMDLGTNGEMALGNKDGIVTCATAAGPVFEGANIKYGMPAYAGAISRVRYVNGELVCETIENESAAGICGTGLIDALSLMFECGIVDETGRMLEEDEIDTSRSKGLERYLGQEDGAPCLQLAGGISVTQRDIRNFQLAKAAIRAGISTMLQSESLGLDDVDALEIAGGFGQYLDLPNAARTGLVPPELLSRTKCVGNSAIEGVSAILLSDSADEALELTMETASYIELSGNETFNKLYVESMGFGD